MIRDFSSFDHFEYLATRYYAPNDLGALTDDPTPLVAKSPNYAAVAPFEIYLPTDLPMGISVWAAPGVSPAEVGIRAYYDASLVASVDTSPSTWTAEIGAWTGSEAISPYPAEGWSLWQFYLEMIAGADVETPAPVYCGSYNSVEVELVDGISSFGTTGTIIHALILNTLPVSIIPIAAPGDNYLFESGYGNQQWSPSHLMENGSDLWTRFQKTSGGTITYREYAGSPFGLVIRYEHYLDVTPFGEGGTPYVVQNGTIYAIVSDEPFTMDVCYTVGYPFVIEDVPALQITTYIDGTEVGVITGQMTTEPDQVSLAVTSGYADSLVISDTITPGASPGAIGVVVPGADIQQEWAPSFGTDHYKIVDTPYMGAPDDEGRRVATSADGDRDVYQLKPAFALGEITAVAARFLVKCPDGESGNLTVRIVMSDGVTTYVEDPTPIVLFPSDNGDFHATYVSSQVYNYNPVKRQPWTIEDIRSLQIGIEADSISSYEIRVYQALLEFTGPNILVLTTNIGSFWSM